MPAPPPRRSPGHSESPALSVTGVTKSFGGLRAVADATFGIAPQRITGLIGPNGAGKSTTINIICGAIRPDAGRITFEGIDLTGQPAHEVARRGVVRTFQRANLFPRLTVMENLLAAVPDMPGDSLASVLLGKRRWAAAERKAVHDARGVLRRFDMQRYENTYAGELSGGEKRMVELMRALMAEPRLLVLDEPMAGVNPTRAREIGTYLRELADDGLTMLLVEHEMSFVERVCDHVVVMANGVVLAQGQMSELRQNREVVDAYLS